MRLLLVYNPRAANWRARKLLPEVEAEFDRYGVAFDLALTDYPEHAVEIVRNADFSRYDGIVAAGGDGTLFEVINGYFRNTGSKKIPLGILPIGTGNAFARDLELEASRWKEAVSIIVGGKTRTVDVGQFRTHGQVYYYLNIIGLGFVADVTRTASKLKIFGNLSYTLGVLFHTITLNAFPIILELDGRVIERENIFVEVSNTRYTSNFLIAPNARIDDGLLDVILVNRLSRFRLLKAFPKVFTGEHIHMDEVDVFQVQRVVIRTPEPKVLSPDGELVGITPVEIECLPRAVEVFWK
ncbi:MAG: diacylglycerol kinase family lipid kinase [Calditrichaeota bacterium]|nr:diacylglycerol kinase family lipid kinase [Calditrichota bacterium]